MGCVSQGSVLLDSERGKQARGNPMQESWDRFEEYGSLKSTLRQASIREKEGLSLGKIHVKNPHQRGPHALKFEDGF